VRTLPWNQEEAVDQVRDRVWRYVTEASRRRDDILLNAAALLQMQPHEVRALAQIQFSLSDEVVALLDEMPQLARRLATTTADERELSAGRLRGPVRWGETHAHRRGSGARRTYVTAPAQRAYDTPENRLLAFVLDAIVEQGTRTGWHTSKRGESGLRVAGNVAEATRWLQRSELADLPRSAPAPATVAAVRAGRNRVRYARALAVHALYDRYVQQLDYGEVRRAVERYALLWSRHDVLLELRCAFDCADELRRAGWEAPPDGLLRPPLIYRGTRGDATVELFYQSVPRVLDATSRYAAVLRLHGVRRIQPLRPDLVVCHRRGDAVRWVLIEVKSGVSGVETLARSTVKDLLLYRRAYEALGRQHGVFGIGYAWGGELRPAAGGDIVLCTPDTLGEALAAVGLG
jgi:hypothetical protein